MKAHTMFKKIKLGFLCLAAAVLGMLAPAHAQYTSDIDIYGGTGGLSSVPNILFVVDNTANWNTAFTNEIAALVATINALPVDKFRVGFMMFTETGSGNSGNDGGYIRSAIRLMDSDYKTKTIALRNG
jgi:type IV pilus assembly protein PilY1